MIKTLFQIVISAFVLTALNFGTSIAAPSLKSEVKVVEDIVLLGDLINDAGIYAQTAVFRSPAPGTTGFLKADEVALAAYRAGLTQLEFGDVETISIERVNNAIDQQTIAQLFTYAIAQKNNDQLSSIRLNTNDLPFSVRHDPSGRSAKIEDLKIDLGRDKVSALLITHTKNGPLQTQLFANLTFEDEAIVLSEDLQRGSIIKRADLTLKTLPRKQIRNTIQDPEKLIGMQIRNSAAMGNPLRARDIRPPTLVLRNREVLINLNKAGLKLTARGKAMENGAVGDMIDVMNTRSQKILQGTVQRDGSVLIGAGLSTPLSIGDAKYRRAKMQQLQSGIDDRQTTGARLFTGGDAS